MNLTTSNRFSNPFYLSIIFIWLFPLLVTAQQNEVRSIIASIDSCRKSLPREKLYLQTDRPYYGLGDTLWFKTYVLNEDFLSATSKSGVFYLELSNDSNRVVKRVIFKVNQGLSDGYLKLDTTDFQEGIYTLRAYTNLMRNFGEELIFKKQFHITPLLNNSWLVNSSLKTTASQAELNLQLFKPDKTPVALREMGIQLSDGKKILLRNNDVETDIDGKLKINFQIPDKSTSVPNIQLKATDKRPSGNKYTFTVPVIFNRPAYTDLQFMPEGGNLVAGITSIVGFKALSEDGKGVFVKGKIINGQNVPVTDFAADHKGMGRFMLLPAAGESYQALLSFADGSTKSYPLPVVQPAGTTLSVNHLINPDSILIKVNASKEILSKRLSYYLIGQVRGVVCYAAKLTLQQPVNIRMRRTLFPTGIARFTLLNAQYQPLNERQLFINHHDQLKISIKPDKPGYFKRDSIALKIEVKDKDKRPVQGSFSLAITDDGQVKIDSLNKYHILSNIMLTSDLKGEVEDPAYYFGEEQQVVRDLDNLMLTQGWTGYSWEHIFGSKEKIKYLPEKEYTISGSVTNALNKPVAGSEVTLFSKKPFMLSNTVTDSLGKFTFQNVFPTDSSIFFLQCLNNKGKSFNVGINIDEFVPLVFTEKPGAAIPWYVDADTTMLRFMEENQKKLTAYNKANGIMLNEVVVVAKKVIKGSKNLNGPGNADLVLDEDAMVKAGKMNLLNLLQQQVKGFNLGVFPPRTQTQSYVIYGKQVRLVFDGVDLDFFFEANSGRNNERVEFLNNYLKSYTTEDIKGIEVMFNRKYEAAYSFHYLSTEDILKISPGNGIEYAFIEITTRSGQGPFLKKTPGTYQYKPFVTFNYPKLFYRPRYSPEIKNLPAVDLRSTIHWEPNIITDKNGEASVSFYSSDKTGTYTAIIEGSNMNGNVGVSLIKINVVGKK